jgi:MFS family permease
MTFEHAPRRKKGFYSAIPQIGVPLGLLLANVAFLATNAIDSSWAWRGPFLLSSVLIGAGILIRLKLQESPEFEEAKEQKELVKNPIFDVLRTNWRTVGRVIALRLAETGGFYVTVTYLLSYMKDEGIAERSVGLTGIIVAAALGVFATPLYGAISDRIGRKPMYTLGCVLTVAFGFPMFLLVNTAEPILIVLAYVIALAVIHDMLAGIQASWFSELFDTKHRTSGASLGYQLSAAISGFMPFIATAVAAAWGWHGVALQYCAVGVIGLLGVAATRETWTARKRAARPTPALPTVDSLPAAAPAAQAPALTTSVVGS